MLFKRAIGAVITTLILASFIGSFLHVLVNERLVTILLFVSAIVTLILYYIALKNRTKLTEFYKKSKRKYSAWSVILSLLIAIPMFSTILIAKGLPSALHFLASSNASLDVSVIKKRSRSFRSKYCSGQVEVKEYQYDFLINSVCVDNLGVWSSLKPGDRLKLIGRQSIFGFSYNKYSKS